MRHLQLTPSAIGLPEGLTASQFSAALRTAAETWSYPQVACSALEVTVGPLARRWVAADDDVNLVGFRSQRWCHNERCGHLDTFPQLAMGMTTVYPEGARGADVRAADIELNGVDFAFVAAAQAQAVAQPAQGHGHPLGQALHEVPLQAVLLHELGHVLGLGDECFDAADGARHGALSDECSAVESSSVMFAPGLNAALSDIDVARLCALYPRAPLAARGERDSAGAASAVHGVDAAARGSLAAYGELIAAGLTLALLCVLGWAWVRAGLRQQGRARL